MNRSINEEISSCFGNARSFFVKQKSLRWFCAVVIVLSFGFRLANQDIFVDSDLMITQPRAFLKSWIGSGRYGLVFTKYLFSLTKFAPFLSTLLAVGALWLFAMLAAFCIDAWTQHRATASGMAVFAGLFLTAPVFAEQYLFTVQAFEVTLGMLLCLTSVYLLGIWLYDGGSKWWAVAGWGMLVWALGSYQAMYAFFITLAIISFILQTLFGKKGCGFREGMVFAVFFVLALACSLGCSAVLRAVVSADASYVQSMVWWGRVDTEQCIHNILVEIKRMYLGGWPVFYSRLFPYTLVLMLGLGFYLWKKQAVRKNWTFFLALLLLCFMPIMVPVLTGMFMPVRANLTFPLVFAFSWTLS